MLSRNYRTVTTIKDVAKHAEVSFTTVSHVLNGTRNVSDAVKQRVLKAVQELQYVPSGIARSLKTNRTHTIGIIIPNNSNPFFAEVVRGIEDACFEAGFSAILCKRANGSSTCGCWRKPSSSHSPGRVP